MDNMILNMKMTNFPSESRDTTIFGKSLCQKKWSICTYITITFEIFAQNQLKIVFLDSYCHVLSRSKIIPDDVIMTSLS